MQIHLSLQRKCSIKYSCDSLCCIDMSPENLKRMKCHDLLSYTVPNFLNSVQFSFTGMKKKAIQHVYTMKHCIPFIFYSQTKISNGTGLVFFNKNISAFNVSVSNGGFP